MTNEDNNYVASRGWELDALHQIMSCCALSSHLLEKLNDLQNDVKQEEDPHWLLNNQFEIRVFIVESLDLASTIRRRVTSLLNVDTTYSCALKHAAEIYQYSTECYLASKDYPFELVNESYRLFTSIVAMALGHKLESCGRCFWDERLANNDSESDINESDNADEKDSSSDETLKRKKLEEFYNDLQSELNKMFNFAKKDNKND